jgi:hypothetical protein
MNTAIVAVIVSLLQGVLAMLESTGVSSAQVDRIITMLIGIVPYVGQIAADIATPIQNIIAALQSKAEITPAQTAALTALDTMMDANFTAGTANYFAKHPLLANAPAATVAAAQPITQPAPVDETPQSAAVAQPADGAGVADGAGAVTQQPDANPPA